VREGDEGAAPVPNDGRALCEGGAGVHTGHDARVAARHVTITCRGYEHITHRAEPSQMMGGASQGKRREPW
jgi:hypothetical protein